MGARFSLVDPGGSPVRATFCSRPAAVVLAVVLGSLGFTTPADAEVASAVDGRVELRSASRQSAGAGLAVTVFARCESGNEAVLDVRVTQTDPSGEPFSGEAVMTAVCSGSRQRLLVPLVPHDPVTGEDGAPFELAPVFVTTPSSRPARATARRLGAPDRFGAQPRMHRHGPRVPLDVYRGLNRVGARERVPRPGHRIVRTIWLRGPGEVPFGPARLTPLPPGPRA